MLKCGQKDNVKYTFGIRKDQVVEEKVERTKFCLKCGAISKEGSKFCSSCGAKY